MQPVYLPSPGSRRLGALGCAQSARARTPVSPGVRSAGFEGLLPVRKWTPVAGGRCKEGPPEFWGQMPVQGAGELSPAPSPTGTRAPEAEFTVRAPAGKGESSRTS